MLVGIKMLIADIYHVPIACSLDLIAMILAIASGPRCPKDHGHGVPTKEGVS